MHYQHTQKVPDKVAAIGAVAGLAMGLSLPGLLTRLAVVGALGAIGYQFRSMTVEVDDNEIKLQFGDGPIRKSFPLSAVDDVKITRTNLLQGWGMHYIGGGWLYNVYGLDAVEVSMADGKRVLIGTDEPDELLAAINNRPIVATPVND